MKSILIAIFLAAAFSAPATAPLRGGDRLRELVVFPEMSINFKWGISCQNNEWGIYQTMDLPDAIAEQREKLKRQSDDAKQLMQLGYLLDQNGETNESQSCYQKAEQLCRNKVAANPQDGLSLTELGVALDGLDKKDEAEHNFRKATLVSSNEWKCWVGLGNFLADDAFYSLFAKNIRNLVAPAQMPSAKVLSYHPSAEVLKKSETLCAEASQCFNRALQLAPREPEVFVQRAGYMSISNLQNCYIRYYRDNEKITTNEWLLSFIAPQTIANLKKVTELKPKDYQYTSLVAYFEYLVSAMKLHPQNATHFAPDTLPDKTRQSIHAAMTRLENLSEDADKKTATGALENLGILNMMFENMPEAATDFRRAVALDPTRRQSWDLLFASLFESASPDELAAVCESRLKYDNSARNHITLSKIFAQKMSKWKEAAEQAEIAEKLETNNVVPPLLLAAIALKQSEQTNYLTIAKIDMNRANTILKEIPAGDEKTKRWREFMLDGAIVSALNNQPQFARDWLNEVLKYFPNDKTAKEILEAIND